MTLTNNSFGQLKKGKFNMFDILPSAQIIGLIQW